MKTKAQAIKALRNEKYWMVREVGGQVELTRVLYGRPIVVWLKWDSKKAMFHVEFPSYIFNSPISHFGPAMDEVRMCRNKAMLTSLVKVLVRSKVWELIENRYFIVVNNHNNKSNKRKVTRQLEDLYAYDPERKKPKKRKR